MVESSKSFEVSKLLLPRCETFATEMRNFCCRGAKLLLPRRNIVWRVSRISGESKDLRGEKEGGVERY